MGELLVQFRVEYINVFLAGFFLYKSFREKIDEKGFKDYRFFMISVFLFALSNFIGETIDTEVLHVSQLTSFLVNVLYMMSFSASTFFSFIYSERINNSKWISSKKIILCLIPFVIFFLMCIASWWSHWIFYVDENSVYQRGSIWPIQFLFCSIFVVIIFLKNFFAIISNNKECAYNKAIFIFSLIIIVGSVLQILHTDSFESVFTTLGAIFVYVEVNSVNKVINARNQGKREGAINANEEMKKAYLTHIEEIGDIVKSANMGMWHIYLFDNEKPRMSGSETMAELLGIDDKGITEEEMYEAWHSRIKPEALDSVNKSVAEMISGVRSENTYLWNHPVLGEQYVRCGGTAKKVEGKGYILSGYHYNVDDIVREENMRKESLEKALADYTKADYDRRTDFLTGLRNRQDLYEFIGKIDKGSEQKISAMYMMDIDNFKRLNDKYGHVYGDEALKKIGKELIKYGKEHNLNLYRYGGEEILAISFEDCSNPNAIALDLVALVSNLKIERDDMPNGVVTISLGYSTNNAKYDKMLDYADIALYRAKELGKNRAVCYENIDIMKQ